MGTEKRHREMKRPFAMRSPPSRNATTRILTIEECSHDQLHRSMVDPRRENRIEVWVIADDRWVRVAASGYERTLVAWDSCLRFSSRKRLDIFHCTGDGIGCTVSNFDSYNTEITFVLQKCNGIGWGRIRRASLFPIRTIDIPHVRDYLLFDVVNR